MAGRYKSLWIGDDDETGEPVYLDRRRLETHFQIMGPTGVGKSRLVLRLVDGLSADPDASVVLINPKGDLATMARDLAIARGRAGRLVLLNPGDPEYLVGYNPLRPNGLPFMTHAKAAREAIGAAWGATSFDHTPQLARFLLLALAAARLCELTLLDALDLLRAGRNPLRAMLIRTARDPWVRRSLEYLDQMTDRRQEELTASTIARLEPFVADPIIREMVMEREHVLDIGDVIDRGQHLYVGIEQYVTGLRPDDVRLFGRLLVNDTLSHAFARPKNKRTPVYLILDEAQMFLTRDLCAVLDQGRELGLHCILAHQHYGQLREEESSGHLLDSVKNCARTKVVFGGLVPEHLDEIARQLFLDQYDPWTVKDELTSLEIEPIEETRLVRSASWTHGEQETESSGEMRQTAITQAASRSWSASRGGSRGRGKSSGSSSGMQSIASDGEMLLPTGEILLSGHIGNGSSDGSFDSQSEIELSSSQRGRGGARSVGRATSQGAQRGRARGRNQGFSKSETIVPFLSHRTRRKVSSRTFLSEQEFLTLALVRLMKLPTGHCVIKTPATSAVFLRLPFVRTPWLRSSVLAAAKKRIFAQDCYLPRAAVEAQAESTLVRLPASRTLKSIPDADEPITTHGSRRKRQRQS